MFGNTENAGAVERRRKNRCEVRPPAQAGNVCASAYACICLRMSALRIKKMNGFVRLIEVEPWFNAAFRNIKSFRRRFLLLV